jgi:hypothetical protein
VCVLGFVFLGLFYWSYLVVYTAWDGMEGLLLLLY